MPVKERTGCWETHVLMYVNNPDCICVPGKYICNGRHQQLRQERVRVPTQFPMYQNSDFFVFHLRTGGAKGIKEWTPQTGAAVSRYIYGRDLRCCRSVAMQLVRD